MASYQILYIDDEADTEKMSSKFDILKEQGIDVVIATGIDVALQLVSERAKQFDALILDIIMPPENRYSLEETSGGTSTGLSLLKDIRKIAPDIPVLVVSIRRSDALPPGLLDQLKIADYVEKPVTASALADFIKKAIYNHRRGRR